MKVLILTAGTRGDVQPFVALARSLDQAGHEAVLAAASRSTSFAADHGVRLVELDDGPGRLMDEVSPDQVRDNKMSALSVLREARKLVRPMLDDVWAVAKEGADIVVHHPRVFAGPHVAEKLGVPSVIGALVPIFVPTKEFPLPVLPNRVPRALNRATYRLTGAMTRPFRKSIDSWRRESLGLTDRGGRHDLLPSPVLHAFSEHLVPAPGDWPESAVTTGFWLLPAPQEWQPTQRLRDFVESNLPTVFVGFGSVAPSDAERTMATVLDALRLAGVRAVLTSGGIDPAAVDLPENVLLVDQVPHDWLFPRVDAVVHHGGAGTTAAAAASGRPQVICPHLTDQPFWGRRTHAAGVAPEPIPHRSLGSENLARAIRAALDDHAEAAALLGKRIRIEDGTGTAIRELERLHNTPHEG